MYVADDKLGIILPPKTGTRAVEYALRRKGFESKKGRHGLCYPCIKRIHTSGGTIAHVTRHPADICVSWYHYDNRHKPEQPEFEAWFPAFVEGCTPYTSGGRRLFYGADHINETIRYELGLEKELNRVLSYSGFPEVELKHIGDESKGRKDWREYFTAEQLDRLYERFQSDFDEFDYTIED